MPTLPKKCGPYISSVTSRGMNLVIRGIVLFFIGVFLALVLNLLQIQRNVTLFPPDVITSIFSSAWWVPPCCGTASGKFSCVFMPGMEMRGWIGSYSCKNLHLKGVENKNFSHIAFSKLMLSRSRWVFTNSVHVSKNYCSANSLHCNIVSRV